MQEIEAPRTPLWRMTDEQLRFIANDDLADWDRRKTAMSILHKRNPDTTDAALAATTSEVDQ